MDKRRGPTGRKRRGMGKDKGEREEMRRKGRRGETGEMEGSNPLQL